MSSIDRLVAGFRAFRVSNFEHRPELYEQLVSQGQSPEVLMIACSDSRVDPALLLSARPGELFVVRNVANLIPPYQPDGQYHGTSAALEFAVRDLKVSHIVILGHSRCGGMEALRHTAMGGGSDREFIAQWVSIAESACRCAHPHDLSSPEGVRLMEHAALKVSLGNLMTFPWVRERVEAGNLELHGWWFDLEKGELWGGTEGPEPFNRVA
ncbi:carbonic anhydrase [Skermanella stibiiresistens SB22]|uniref:Carbonic anhydrase n=1 Tax=Skermanella stibiiresistens SB22 TaxID=1385369 RepID=W9GYX0_9PROT|nr:carbonic anhydrase [Skermanella stibiiresistens]EWY37637.1 carbonic anhydrase [Skermanella stibiiresistens SB22]